MLCCPARPPARRSRRFPGGTRSSPNRSAASRRRSLRWARRCTSGGSLRPRTRSKILRVSASRKDRITGQSVTRSNHNVNRYYGGGAQPNKAVPRNGRGFACTSVHVDRMSRALAEQLASLGFEVPDEIPPLHRAAIFRGSRITSPSPASSLASARLASSTSSAASRRFSRASSRVAPCVLAPGSLLHEGDVAFRHLLEHGRQSHLHWTSPAIEAARPAG